MTFGKREKQVTVREILETLPAHRADLRAAWDQVSDWTGLDAIVTQEIRESANRLAHS